jgi:hypothetical protein
MCVLLRGARRAEFKTACVFKCGAAAHVYTKSLLTPDIQFRLPFFVHLYRTAGFVARPKKCKAPFGLLLFFQVPLHTLSVNPIVGEKPVHASGHARN